MLYHESAHIWQWNGNGKTPGQLIERIANYVKLNAGLGPSHWVKPGQGDHWNQATMLPLNFLVIATKEMNLWHNLIKKK